MGILAFLLLGLLAGVIAKALLPGRNSAGWLLTLVLGVLGAVLGGWLGSTLLGVGLGEFFSIRTWLLAIAGAVIVFLIYGAVTGGKRRR
ncbi:MAG TPA: GlsB/YeaQ/YmgE family stress response membrane protein [Cellulomonas sp.]|nr:GlsB/YeaQ/YmgE family stress response membrane protein [Cellulomonas sp.]